MLKLNKYYIQDIENLKDFTIVIFVIIDDLYNEHITNSIKNRPHKDLAILSDSEIITISIIGELLSIDSERAWVSYVNKNLKDLFPKMCERSRFNRTRRNLLSVIQEISKKLNLMVSSFSSQNRIVDSFPLPVCKWARAHFHKTFKADGASYGKCPSKKETYYGYKVHAMTTFEGYITDFTITKASIDDREAVWELVENYNSPLLIIGDKGYISQSLRTQLKSEKDITLIYMKRNNCKEAYPKWLRKTIFKIRRRIETTFSQLMGQLNAQVVKAKSFWGLKTRLQTKILAFNLCFFVKELLGKTNDLAKIKDLVF